MPLCTSVVVHMRFLKICSFYYHDAKLVTQFSLFVIVRSIYMYICTSNGNYSTYVFYPSGNWKKNSNRQVSSIFNLNFKRKTKVKQKS